MGRPTDFTEELAAQILQRIAAGESLRRICADEAMPGRETVREWLIRPASPEFPGQYARAREAQADAMFEEILEIADDGTNDWTEKQLGDDGPTVSVVDHEHIARSKLRVDARKWMVGKLAPKKYGDKIAHEHAGADGGPIKVQSQTPDQVKDELAHIFGRAIVAGAADPGPDQATEGAVRPGESAEQPPAGDPVVQPGPDSGGEQEPSPPAPGEAVAGAERPVFSFDDDL